MMVFDPLILFSQATDASTQTAAVDGIYCSPLVFWSVPILCLGLGAAVTYLAQQVFAARQRAGQRDDHASLNAFAQEPPPPLTRDDLSALKDELLSETKNLNRDYAAHVIARIVEALPPPVPASAVRQDGELRDLAGALQLIEAYEKFVPRRVASALGSDETAENFRRRLHAAGWQSAGPGRGRKSPCRVEVDAAVRGAESPKELWFDGWQADGAAADGVPGLILCGRLEFKTLDQYAALLQKNFPNAGWLNRTVVPFDQFCEACLVVAQTIDSVHGGGSESARQFRRAVRDQFNARVMLDRVPRQLRAWIDTRSDAAAVAATARLSAPPRTYPPKPAVPVPAPDVAPAAPSVAGVVESAAPPPPTSDPAPFARPIETRLPEAEPTASPRPEDSLPPLLRPEEELAGSRWIDLLKPLRDASERDPGRRALFRRAADSGLWLAAEISRCGSAEYGPDILDRVTNDYFVPVYALACDVFGITGQPVSGVAAEWMSTLDHLLQDIVLLKLEWPSVSPNPERFSQPASSELRCRPALMHTSSDRVQCRGLADFETADLVAIE